MATLVNSKTKVMGVLQVCDWKRSVLEKECGLELFGGMCFEV